MIQGKHITAIIPAKNEALAVGHVIESLKNIGVHQGDYIDEIIVVDNASTDQTQSICLAMGVKVVYERNNGYGAACMSGIQTITNTDIVVFVDGDFTYRSLDIENVISGLIDLDIDLVMGSRFIGTIYQNSMTKLQLFGTQLICKIIHWRFDYHFSDLGSLRAIRFDKLLQLDIQDTRFGWTAEMQVKALKQKLTMYEIPVTSRLRIGKSKISGTFKGSLLASYDLLKRATLT